MKTITILSILMLLTAAHVCVGQLEELQAYKDLYRTADSINISGTVYSPDSITRSEAIALDSQHPSKYFQRAVELFSLNRYNDAAFLHYLGLLRYRFYNSANPNYKADSDGALSGALQAVVGEVVVLYLRTNISTYTAVLRHASNYHSNTDYAFFPKQNSPDTYRVIADSYSAPISDMEANGAQYTEEWKKERELLITEIDKAIAEYNKMKTDGDDTSRTRKR